MIDVLIFLMILIAGYFIVKFLLIGIVFSVVVLRIHSHITKLSRKSRKDLKKRSWEQESRR